MVGFTKPSCGFPYGGPPHSPGRSTRSRPSFCRLISQAAVKNQELTRDMRRSLRETLLQRRMWRNLQEVFLNPANARFLQDEVDSQPALVAMAQQSQLNNMNSQQSRA
eukprot:m.29085 g.29085  ORF g.29085 m.29085 type:complete len:108 (+) comp9109_c0_seq1:497-820(+)